MDDYWSRPYSGGILLQGISERDRYKSHCQHCRYQSMEVAQQCTSQSYWLDRLHTCLFKIAAQWTVLTTTDPAYSQAVWVSPAYPCSAVVCPQGSSLLLVSNFPEISCHSPGCMAQFLLQSWLGAPPWYWAGVEGPAWRSTIGEPRRLGFICFHSIAGSLSIHS